MNDRWFPRLHRSVYAGIWICTSLAFGTPATASESFGSFFTIGSPTTNPAWQVCFSVGSLSNGNFQTTQRFTRARPGSLLNGLNEAGYVYEVETSSVFLLPSGLLTTVCFTPNDFQPASRRLELIMENGSVNACRGLGRVHVPRTEGTTTTLNLDMGSAGAPGATAVEFSLDLSGLAPEWSVSIPASVTIPPPGQRVLIPVIVNHPVGLPLPPQIFTVRATFDNRMHFFEEIEVSIESSGVIPTVSEWGLASLGALLLVCGGLAARRVGGAG